MERDSKLIPCQASDNLKLRAHPRNYLCRNGLNNLLGLEPSGNGSELPTAHRLNLYW
jgi:hypothetical protein